MFQLIASDLREFASSVKQDTAAVVHIVQQDAMGVLDKLDETMGRPVPSEAQREAEFRMTIREVYATALPEATSIDITTGTGVDIASAEEFEATEIAFFLGAFDINEKTEEISVLLQQNQSLRALFEELVPIQVSYEEFWRRHFYRCDADRIQRAWDMYESIKGDSSSNAVSDAISGVLSAPLRLAMQPITAIRSKVNVETATSTAVTKSADKMLRDAQKEVEIMQSALGISNNRISALRFSVDELKSELKNKKEANTELVVEVALLKKQLQHQKESMKYLEDQFLLHVEGGSSPVSTHLPTKKSHRQLLDASARTDTTESSSSKSSADHHIGTCVTLVPTAESSNTSPVNRSMFWNADFWNGGASESSTPDGWSSEEDEASSQVDPLPIGLETAS